MILRIVADPAPMDSDPWATTVEDKWEVPSSVCLMDVDRCMLATFQPWTRPGHSNVHSFSLARCPIRFRLHVMHRLIFRVCSGPQQTRLRSTGTRTEFKITRMPKEQLYFVSNSATHLIKFAIPAKTLETGRQKRLNISSLFSLVGREAPKDHGLLTVKVPHHADMQGINISKVVSHVVSCNE